MIFLNLFKLNFFFLRNNITLVIRKPNCAQQLLMSSMLKINFMSHRMPYKNCDRHLVWIGDFIFQISQGNKTFL